MGSIDIRNGKTIYFCKKNQMHILSTNDTIYQIVSMLKEFPEKKQHTLLYQLKLLKARSLSKKLSSAKPNINATDEEIADMIHEFRKNRK
jgi:hypothetical protein